MTSVKVSNVFECHACDAPLLAEAKADVIVYCPKCGSPNGPGAAKKYFDPFYVSEQHRKINDVEAWKIFVLKRNPKKVQACGQEFLDAMKILLYKQMTSDQLKEIVNIAREIGAVGEAVDSYVKKGGLYDGKEDDEKEALTAEEYRESLDPENINQEYKDVESN